MNQLPFLLLIIASLFPVISAAQSNPLSTSTLDKIYGDETHCLTIADMRGEKDRSIACFCRDAIVDARYVYATYIVAGKDANLNGAFLRLEQDIAETCGKDAYYANKVAEENGWVWDGPEVIRTYPSDDVIKRIKPEGAGRWVPFTVQLIYRDAQRRIARTENYSSKEFLPNLPAVPK
jgi:hypothetical protein